MSTEGERKPVAVGSECNDRLGAALGRLLDELEAEMPYTRRASYWVPVIKAAREDYEQLKTVQGMLDAALDGDWEHVDLTAYRCARSGWKPSA